MVNARRMRRPTSRPSKPGYAGSTGDPRPRSSVLDGRVERHRPRIGQGGRRFGRDRLERTAVVIKEFVEHALDRLLDLLGTAIAHIGVLIAGSHNRNPGLLAILVIGNDAGIRLEHWILRSERKNLESAGS